MPIEEHGRSWEGSANCFDRSMVTFSSRGRTGI